MAKLDRFGAIREGEIVVLENVVELPMDSYSREATVMFQATEALSDDVADEVNHRLELEKPQAAPEPAPKPKPAPRRDTSHDRDDDFKPS